MTVEIHLLRQAQAIERKYKEIIKVTGEGYNIFQILKVDANETRLHSAFIADLLNPLGSHGLDDIFLNLLLKDVLPDNFEFDTKKVSVEVEKNIGFINDDGTEGGRLDIFLSDRNNSQIFIENKIYAGDQKNQLIRYSNYNKKAVIFYLCLAEKEVDNFSCGNLVKDKDYYLITYKAHILSWLETCKKQAVSYPILRETITQYINLIKHLTGQTINNNMKNEVAQLIANDKDSLEAAFSIASNIDAACDLLLVNLKLIINEISEELNLLSEFDIDWNRNYSGFNFSKKQWKKAFINFQFQSYDKNLVYGVSRENEEKDLNDKLTVDVYNRLKSIGGSSNSWWLFVKNVEEPFSNWNNKEPWIGIHDGSIKNFIKDKVETILKYLNNYPL